MFTKIALIICTPDVAAINIKERLLEKGSWKKLEESFQNHSVYQYFHPTKEIKLYTTDTACVYCEHIDKKIDVDLFIFPTKHQSKSGIPSLTVHTQGNWGVAEIGGKDNTLGIAPGTYLARGFLKLKELQNKDQLNYQVIQECTHHGPDINKPAMFIEVGSTEKEWQQKEPAKIIAETIQYLLTEKFQPMTTAIGIGGLHHCPDFSKVTIEKNIAFTHVCPKYMLKNLNREMILQALERSVEQPKFIYLNKKGLGSEKERIFMLAEKIAEEKQVTIMKC